MFNSAEGVQSPADLTVVLNIPLPHSSPTLWLIRIPEVLWDYELEILRTLGAVKVKNLGRDYRLVRCDAPESFRLSAAAKYVSWNLPVHHSWPCNPQKTIGFIEKAAQTLAEKFAASHPQSLMIGALDPGLSNQYYRSLASNLRGRALQVFPSSSVSEIRNAETQNAELPTLFCLIGKEGLFCGLQSPQASGGFHPGGTKFIRQNTPDTISRAGAKIVEALHHLQLYRPAPTEGAHWLELGASPGGMTAELLTRKYRVTAVDRAPLDVRLENMPGLRAVIGDASLFAPAKGESYDAILSDMNGPAQDSIRHIIRLSRHLKPGGLVIFTLKTSGAETFTDLNQLETAIVTAAAAAQLALLARTHLTYNRHEFTLFFECRPI